MKLDVTRKADALFDPSRRAKIVKFDQHLGVFTTQLPRFPRIGPPSPPMDTSGNPEDHCGDRSPRCIIVLALT
jgi:hypothetical protein